MGYEFVIHRSRHRACIRFSVDEHYGHHFRTKRNQQYKIKNAKGLVVSIAPEDFK